MSWVKEFKSFAMRGNVMDVAVGVIVGGAFGKIVSSLVNDVIMPVIGIITGGIDLTGLKATIGDANITYGNFIQNIIDFIIIAFSIFIIIKGVNKLSKKQNQTLTTLPNPTKEEELLTEIRDLLKKQYH
ncbi:MAG: large conductance mechanosensitive channel protein MscL [Bacteroidales bacterium]